MRQVKREGLSRRLTTGSRPGLTTGSRPGLTTGSRPGLTTGSRPGLAVALLCGLLAGACYEGPGPKEPPPGSPGGFCAPGSLCNEMNVVCDPEGDFCYDKFNVCRGFFCGEHGQCAPVQGKPTCVCDPGYSNEMYSLFCEPAL